MVITIISDTHGAHAELGSLSGDVLIHCGDLAGPFDGKGETVADLDDWFDRQCFDLILYTGGNHDFDLQRRLTETEQPYRNAIYLGDIAIEYEGVKFYGAPWTPFMRGFAFYQDDIGMQQKWALIPDDVDVLITHTPPYGILDRPRGSDHAGCPYLRERVLAVRPKLHCFGHVHAGHGILDKRGTRFINASMVGGSYQINNPPIRIDL